MIIALSSMIWVRLRIVQLVDVRSPIAQATSTILSGIQNSFAGLQGWIATGNPKFKQDRTDAWEEEIRPAYEKINDFSQNPKNDLPIEPVHRLLEILNNLEEWQWWIEEIAHTPGNNPGKSKLIKLANPVFEDILLHITKMIEVEKTREFGKEGKKILSLMADFRGAFTAADVQLANFVIDEQQANLDEFRKFFNEAKNSLARLSKYTKFMSKSQISYLKKLEIEVKVLQRYIHEIIELVQFGKSDIAVLLLETKAKPIQDEAIILIKKLNFSQQLLMKQDATNVVKANNIVFSVFFILICLMIGIAVYLSKKSTQKILIPIKSLVKATTDITGGKKGEDIPILSNDEIGELTRSFNLMNKSLHISERELAGTIEKLQRSNRELEQFAYIASHDLQEPLRLVASYTQLLERRYKDKIDKEANIYINYAVDGVKRMQSLIRALLNYSRISTHEIEFKMISLQSAFERSLQNLNQTIEERKPIIECGPLPEIYGDDIQMERLFQNLISNAIKYSAKDPAQIKVSCAEKENQWLISVKDNGIGIDSKYLKQIFGIFKRLHNTDQFSGLGIGLSVVKRIVEIHGGKVWVESKISSGSTFYFTLPKHQENEYVSNQTVSQDT